MSIRTLREVRGLPDRYLNQTDIDNAIDALGDWSNWEQVYWTGNQLALGTTAGSARDALELGEMATEDIGSFAQLNRQRNILTAADIWELAPSNQLGSESLTLRLMSGSEANGQRGAFIELNGADVAGAGGAFRLVGSGVSEITSTEAVRLAAPEILNVGTSVFEKAGASIKVASDGLDKQTYVELYRNGLGSAATGKFGYVDDGSKELTLQSDEADGRVSLRHMGNTLSLDSSGLQLNDSDVLTESSFDTTALVKLGYGGNLAARPSQDWSSNGADIPTGFYIFDPTTQTGAPTGVTVEGVMYHAKSSTGIFSQSLHLVDGDIYSRSATGSVWGEWTKHHTASNQLSLGTTQASARTALGLGTMATAATDDFIAKADQLAIGQTADTARAALQLGTMATATASEYTKTTALTTSLVTEGNGLYFTNARAISALATLKGVAGGYASLDSSGKIDISQLPALAITNTYTVATQAAMLALDVQTGDIAVRTDLNKSYILRQEPATTLANWTELLSPTGAVASFNGRTGSVMPAAGDYTFAMLGSKPTTVEGFGITDAATTSDLAGKADSSHSHAMSDITGLTAALNSKLGSGINTVGGVDFRITNGSSSGSDNAVMRFYTSDVYSVARSAFLELSGIDAASNPGSFRLSAAGDGRVSAVGSILYTATAHNFTGPISSASVTGSSEVLIGANPTGRIYKGSNGVLTVRARTDDTLTAKFFSFNANTGNFEVPNGNVVIGIDQHQAYHAGNLLNIGRTAATARTALGLGSAALESLENISTAALANAEGLLVKSNSVGSGVDLNTMTTSGIFLQNASANATLELNYPTPTAGWLEVMANPTKTFVFQRYSQFNSGITFVRGYYNGTWGAWRTQIDSEGASVLNGLVDARGSGGVGFRSNRVDAAVNASYEAKTTGGSVYFGQGRAGRFAVGSAADLTVAATRWLEVNASEITYLGKDILHRGNAYVPRAVNVSGDDMSFPGEHSVHTNLNNGAPEAYSTVVNMLYGAANASAQFAFTFSGNSKFWFRSKHDTASWKGWVEMYHSGNQLNIGTTAATARTALGLGTMATAATSAFLPITGGSITGGLSTSLDVTARHLRANNYLYVDAGRIYGGSADTYLIGGSSTSNYYLRPQGWTATGQSIFYANGNVTFSGALTSTDYILSSDERLKTDEVPLKTRGRLQPYEYTRISTGERELGFMAQAVEELYPTAVFEISQSEDVDGNKIGEVYKGISYNRLIPVLSAQINEVEDEVTLLKEENVELRTRLEALEKLVANLVK